MRIVLALALAVSLTGCPFGDDDGDPANYVAVDQLDSAFRDARCTYLARCGQFPDKATCLTANLPSFVEAFSLEVDASTRAAIDQGRILYNGTRMKGCLDALATATCDTTDADSRLLRQRCWNYLTGTVAGGQPCVLDAECISQRCSGSVVDAECQPGTCIGDTPPATEPAVIGMPCTYNPGCVPGAYCDPGAGMCMRAKDEGELCNDFEQCAFGLWCAGNTGTRTCKPLPRLNEPCPDYLCRDDGTFCSSAGTCQQLGLPPAVCTGTTRCADAYECDAGTGQCVPAPSLGETCSSSAPIRCFDASTVCDGATFTCITPKPDGASCTNSFVCASGYCDVLVGRCAPQPICTTMPR